MDHPDMRYLPSIVIMSQKREISLKVDSAQFEILLEVFEDAITHSSKVNTPGTTSNYKRLKSDLVKQRKYQNYGSKPRIPNIPE